MEDALSDVNTVQLVFFIFCSIFVIYLGDHFYPDLKWFFPPAIVGVFIFWSALFLGRAVWWKFRDHGYRVQVGGVSASINGPPVSIPDPAMGDGFLWDLFDLGAVPPFKGMLGILVVPHNQIYETAGFYSGLTLIRRWNLNVLPAKVQSYLDDVPGKFNTDVIYFGKYSQNFIDNSSAQLDLNSQITANQSLIANLQKTNKKDFAHYEQLKNLGATLTGDDSWISKKLKSIRSKDDAD